MLDTIQSIAIAHADGVYQFQQTLGCVCLAALLLTAGGCAAYRILKRWKRCWTASSILLVPLVLALVVYGSTKKKTPTVSFPYTDPEKKYFTDTGSYVTNDWVHLSFASVGVPTSADFNGCYRQLDSTNDEDWVQFLTGTVGAYLTPSDIPFTAATNYNFMFFSTYTAGPTVHTNGVLNVKWGVPTNDVGGIVRALPIQSEVRLDWKAIATPNAIYGTNDDVTVTLETIQTFMEEDNE